MIIRTIDEVAESIWRDLKDTSIVGKCTIDQREGEPKIILEVREWGRRDDIRVTLSKYSGTYKIVLKKEGV